MQRKKVLQRAFAASLTAAMCITSLPSAGLEAVWAKGVAAEREDASIVYFVDCGDYVVGTVNDGEQLGTHNSVTDQVYGKDPATGYQWGIVDVEEELTGNDRTNGTAPEGKGIATANTWAMEQLGDANKDYPTAASFRYSKNFYEKGYDERYVDYAFELEAGSYEITVGCNNTWGCADSPVITTEISGTKTVLQDDFRVPDGGTASATGTVTLTEDAELTLDVRGTGADNLCASVSSILIKSIKTGETEDEKNVRKDKEALTIVSSTKEDITLPVTGENGSSITWKSSDDAVLSAAGKVTRPTDGKNVKVTLTATITSGEVSDTAEFEVEVIAEKVPAPVDRDDNRIVYFVDCGDYIVSTVSKGDQFGTHNSVTDQAYGEDEVTGYKWGIVDGEELVGNGSRKNGTAPSGKGVFTANTWAYEQNTANTDYEKTSSNRYTKNFWEKGIDERFLQYKFQLEDGKYEVYVCCTDPWGCSKTPNVYLNYGTDEQVTVKEALNASATEIAKTVYEVKNGELTVDVRATGDDNKAINLAYILIRQYKELTPEEAEADAKKRVANDCAALTLENTDVTSDLELATEGANETTITWESSNETLLSHTGKVTRPKAGEKDTNVTLTATVSYGEYSQSKKFEVTVLAESDITGLNEFALSDIELTDDYYVQVTEKDVEFLNKFDPDRLLYNFRLTAGYTAAQIADGRFDFNKDGVYAKASYNGWENSRIGGHTLGHYLAAVAQASANGYGDVKGEDGKTINERLKYLIDELQDCQDKLGSGFIFGATLASQSDPERQFNLLEAGDTRDTWVPWYTMHKIMNGLVETYKYTGNQTALEVAEKLGEWIYNRTSKWNSTIQSRVLGVEYGGMNDCLYELYKCAKNTGYANTDHFAAAAHWFDEDRLFELVLSGKSNVLNGRHANCTIPKFIGALNRYRALNGEEDVDKYLAYAERFWNLLISKHTYITGGNSECEFFGADNVLDAERSHCNCETCNTHNMLKLTRELYRITGDKKYADYYETTFINAIMASVNEDTGMTTYFQPMATGFFKVYCNADLEKNYFWCCTGTGLENFTKLGDSFYFYSGNKLIVNQYTSSKVTWKAKNIQLVQDSDIPNSEQTKFTVKLLNGAGSADMDLRLRVPDWAAAAPTVKVNGTAVNVTASNGYLSINRTWKDGDTVDVTLPMEIKAYTLPDNAGKVYGFKYGPIVLAAELGRDDKMGTYQIGVQCDVCKTKIVNGQERTATNGYGSTSNQGTLSSETLNMTDDISVAEFLENIENYLVKDEKELKFTLTGTDWGGDEDLVFVPYYRINDQRYGIYWLFSGADPAEVQARILEAKKAGRDANVYLEGVGVGYGTQTEGNEKYYPHMKETGEGSVGDMSILTRYAKAGGSFSYLFKIDPDKTNYINCQYAKADNGKTMVIKVGDTVVAKDTLDYSGDDKIYTVQYEIPKEAIATAADYAYTDETTGEAGTKKVIRISFSGSDDAASPALNVSVYTSTNYDDNAGITAITSDIGTITKASENAYTLEVPADTRQVQLKTTLADKFGLLYINKILTDDTKAKAISISSDETVVDLLVYAEDHTTSAAYTLTIKKAAGTGNEGNGGNNGNGGNGGTTDQPSNPGTGGGSTGTGTGTGGSTSDTTVTPAATAPTAESIMADNSAIPSKKSEEAKNAKYSILKASAVAAGKKSNKIKWSKMKNADGYVVFGALCNTKSRKYSYQVLEIIEKNTTTSYTHKNLKKGTYYKYIVQAYKMVDGKAEILATSKTMYSATTGGKYGNAGSIKLNKKKVSLKKGKSVKLTATIVKKGKKPYSYRKVLFESSNTKIATVNRKGVIKAKKKGSCYIYAYAQNGVYKRIKVTVKK